jgi:eukaryotic-like serine/threonine-protein kinase
MGSGHPLPDSIPAALDRGASIGRYVVLGLVGRGGMGEVYAAYDPELDRRVAVKLLRVKPGHGVTHTEGRQRTLREGQAIARLSHPNVVVVFDVGTFEDKVFIAMEFVEGNNVTHWLQAAPRTWQEVLKVFVAAGRGLAAAHEKGIVHRDFKPDNVMVGRGGQVRVTDFGLARQLSPTPPTGVAQAPIPKPVRLLTPLPEKEYTTDTMVLEGMAGPPAVLPGTRSSNSGALDMKLTRPGAMIGTPVYMAPEQFLGLPTDERSDQFSFCISLYEALYGERPFMGEDVNRLAANVVHEVIRPAPPGSKVPPWLRKIVLRGLKSKYAERWPSMEELLGALEKNPNARRRKWALISGTLVLVAGLGFGLRSIVTESRNLCVGGPERLAGVWDFAPPGEPEPPRQAQIRRAFIQTGKSYAPDVFNTVNRALTTYAQHWTAMYKDACEATHVRGDQSSEVLDLRMSCLQERLGGMRALTDVFAEATGEVVENAVSAANSLPSLDRCADVPLLRAIIEPPADTNGRAKVPELRRRGAEIKARFDAGRFKETLKETPELVADARVVGYRPVLAETLLRVGSMYAKAGDLVQAEKVLTESFWVADSSRHDEVRAEAAANLVFVVGYRQARFAEGHRWATAADSILQRIGGHDVLRAWLLNDLGLVHHLEGDEDQAVQAMKRALALKEKALGPEHPDVSRSEGNLGMFLQALGRHQDALAHLTRARAAEEKSLGQSHPEVAIALVNTGEILNALGRTVEARHAYERAAAIWESELGPNHLDLAFALTGIGLSYLGEGNPSAALVPLERAQEIRQAQEKQPATRAETSFALARALWESGRNRGRARMLAELAKTDYTASPSGARKLAEVENWIRLRIAD